MLSILSSTGIFLVFRLIEKRGVANFPVIAINYIIAFLLGLMTSRGTFYDAEPFPLPFYGLAILIGILFIIFFFVVARSSQKAGMGITTIAGKMSVIFPIAFSIIYDPQDEISALKLSGIMVALPGVFLTVWKRKKALVDPEYIYLPLLLFAGMGIVDSLIKLAQHHYISDINLSFFTAILFGISALIGIVLSLFRKNRLWPLIDPGALFWGTCLGTVNFGSIYFLVRTLDHDVPFRGSLDSSIVFGVNNIGIVSLSVILGYFIFREKLTSQNIAGMLLCIVAIVLLSLSN